MGNIEKNVVENDTVKIEEKNTNEIILSTGKKVLKRERRGQHHIVEKRLLSVCSCSVKMTEQVLLWEI